MRALPESGSRGKAARLSGHPSAPLCRHGGPAHPTVTNPALACAGGGSGAGGTRECDSCVLGSRNHRGWKRSQSLAQPAPTLNHVPKCHMDMGRIEEFGSQGISAQEVFQVELVIYRKALLTLQGFPSAGMTPPHSVIAAAETEGAGTKPGCFRCNPSAAGTDGDSKWDRGGH